MSTFSLLILILILLIFGVQIFFYCVDIEMPRLTAFLTLMLILMLTAEMILAIFEFPAKVIDGIVFISMGNKVIAVGCGIVIFIVLTFIFIMIYPKIPWKKVVAPQPIKSVILGSLIIVLTIYTELFNGAYSFKSLSEYNTFKSEFKQYDRHFWPTKFIEGTEDTGKAIVTTYSVYPWDVEIPDGRQFAYKVITFYSTDEQGNRSKMYYYPFTYKLYAGVSSLPIEHEAADDQTQTVSNSDAQGTSATTTTEPPTSSEDELSLLYPGYDDEE